YDKMGKKRDAFDMYNRIVQQFPDSASAYAARAVYEQANNLAEVALYDWEQAVSRNPSDTGYQISRVELLITLGRRDEARAALDDMQKHGVA
ncbi:tetratricopeptide repeat protein, partial [Enterococcus faecalis]|uniref:tetratricopeptide repeat protein n=1 Tax=Enterococcus faecalis TaxID=1351 RepID=UPI003985A705